MEGQWYRECERKGCEIVRGRERKLEGEMERGTDCRRRERRGFDGIGGGEVRRGAGSWCLWR